MRDDVRAGHFWSDRIADLRERPRERLDLAMQMLPLPAAFREAALAIRSLVREQRKSGGPWDELVRLLYWIAAVDSLSVPYSTRLRDPGYNIMESIPGDVILGLEVEYRIVGYARLALLNKTDIRWVVELNGEPEQHSTLNEIHQDVWRHYEDLLLREREQGFLRS